MVHVSCDLVSEHSSPIYSRITSLAFGQPYDWAGASIGTLNNIGILYHLNLSRPDFYEPKQNKDKAQQNHVHGTHWVDGLVLDCGISSVLAMEIPRSCTKPSKCLIQMTSNGCHGISNHRYFECMFNSLFRQTKETHRSSAVVMKAISDCRLSQWQPYGATSDVKIVIVITLVFLGWILLTKTNK